METHDEHDESVISFGPLKSLLHSLDSCFNYMLSGLPREYESSSSSCDLSTKDHVMEMHHVMEYLDLTHHDEYDGTKKIKDMTIAHTQIPHCKQEETWDCGVSCIIMIVKYLRSLEMNQDGLCDSENYIYPRHTERLQKQWMLEKVQTKSIWTIDLVILLDSIFDGSPQRLKFPQRNQQNGSKITYLYCSTLLGVDNNYKGFTYYKNAFDADEKRVKTLFRMARKKNLPMMKLSNMDNFDSIVDIVSRENIVAIVLIDYNVFKNDQVDVNPKNFSGHYVILCGISTDEKDVMEANKCFGPIQDTTYCLVIKDPGSTNKQTFVAKETFERCWRAAGTDCDILFIEVND